MSSFKSFFLLTMLLVGNIGVSFAHALYIDTNSEAKPGQTHEVNVYYSEFADRTHEKVADWYSDVAQFELWLVQPDGTRVLLETQIKNDHVSSSFTPKEKGVYRLEISHTTADVAEGTAYQFNAFAQVLVGTSNNVPSVAANGADFALVDENPSSENQSFKIYLNGQPEAEISATLFLPSGKTKVLKSNENGVFEFSSEEKGVHFLEATIYHETKKGATKKESFEALWRCATQKIEL